MSNTGIPRWTTPRGLLRAAAEAAHHNRERNACGVVIGTRRPTRSGMTMIRAGAVLPYRSRSTAAVHRRRSDLHSRPSSVIRGRPLWVPYLGANFVPRFAHYVNPKA